MNPVRTPVWLFITALALVPAASCKDDEKPATPEKTSVKDIPAVKTAVKKAADGRALKAKPEKKVRAEKISTAPTRAAARMKERENGKTGGAHGASSPEPTDTPRSGAPSAAPAPRPARPGPSRVLEEPRIPDLRLLLTALDVTQTGGGRTAFRRRAMPGMIVTPDQDALYYEPEKGSSYGFGIQVFHEKNMARAKQRFESMFASYPNSVEIAPVAGNTFFAYWDEVLFVSFIHRHKGLIVVLSCGRPYCDSDSLYTLAKKVGSRLR